MVLAKAIYLSKLSKNMVNRCRAARAIFIPSSLGERSEPKIAVHAPSNSHFPFIFNHIPNSKNLLFDNLMLLSNREGSFHTESFPMES